MAAITVRNLSEATYCALKQRAALHGISTEAEIRAILAEAARPKTKVMIGTELAAFGQNFDRLRLDLARDQTPTEPAAFG
jgi:plasmid stability protein